MRRFLIPVLFVVLIAGCSVPAIGPHRIDVQQGNALDQENVARLKLGLNRAQVRFLLGTPLVVDPFRTDRWDYVYLFYKSGQLTEQKRVTLFFEGDTLARVEGDVPEATTTPVAEKATEPEAKPTQPAVVLVQKTEPEPPRQAAAPPLPVAPTSTPPEPAEKTEPAAKTVVAAAPVTMPETVVPAEKTARSTPPPSTVVPPLPSPPQALPYVDPRVPAEPAPGMVVETDVEQIRPDVIPPFPEPAGMPESDDDVLKSVEAWARAWAARNETAYLAAYDVDFVPVGDASRADWEARRRLLLGMASKIDLRVDSASVERNNDGSATVTFNQFYRSDSYRDAVVKQLRLVARDGRWLIVEEKILSVLRGVQP